MTTPKERAEIKAREIVDSVSFIGRFHKDVDDKLIVEITAALLDASKPMSDEEIERCLVVMGKPLAYFRELDLFTETYGGLEALKRYLAALSKDSAKLPSLKKDETK